MAGRFNKVERETQVPPERGIDAAPLLREWEKGKKGEREIAARTRFTLSRFHHFTLSPFLCALALIAILLPQTSIAAESTPLLTKWLNAQTNIQTWSADFAQTRTLKSLAQPLTSHGRVWFAAPNQFRWELGNPPQTIAVRQPTEMLVIYPRLKRAERYPLTGEQTGPWRDALALLEAGFPRSQAELDSRFRVVSQTVADGICEVTLQPKSASARRMMPQIKIAFATNDFSLRATELQFADGSTMRNDFTNAVLNPKLEGGLFEPEVGKDFKIVEPLKR